MSLVLFLACEFVSCRVSSRLFSAHPRYGTVRNHDRNLRTVGFIKILATLGAQRIGLVRPVLLRLTLSPMGSFSGLLLAVLGCSCPLSSKGVFALETLVDLFWVMLRSSGTTKRLQSWRGTSRSVQMANLFVQRMLGLGSTLSSVITNTRFPRRGWWPSWSLSLPR